MKRIIRIGKEDLHTILENHLFDEGEITVGVGTSEIRLCDADGQEINEDDYCIQVEIDVPVVKKGRPRPSSLEESHAHFDH